MSRIVSKKLRDSARGQACQVTEWKPVAGFEGLYEVSGCGQVRSLPRRVSSGAGKSRFAAGRLLAQATKSTYPCVCLCRDGKQYFIHVHRLVAKAFVPGAGPLVRHLDGDPMNAHYTNLAWGTHADNEADKAAHGRALRGEGHHQAKLNEEMVRTIRRLGSQGLSQLAIARQLNIGRGSVGRVIRNEYWRHVA